MTLLNEILVLDDFCINPEGLRHYALTLDYDTPKGPEAWRGFRCREPDFTLLQSVKDRLSDINPSVNSLFFEGFFHYCLEETKNTCVPSFELGRVHCDDSVYAGVLYLKPYPKCNSGTSFFDNQMNEIYSVENVFNRLIFYPSNIPHAPTDLFGSSIQDARLTLNIFAY